MSIQSRRDLLRLMRIGQIVGGALADMQAALKPGMTTAELDEIGAEYLLRHGARSAPQLVYDFPAATCISINDEVAHGIPGDRVIQKGDLVNIDVSAELDGYFADTGATTPVPPVDPALQMLCDCTLAARDAAINALSAGLPLNVIGRAVQREAGRCGFNIIRQLCGHGVGGWIHEEPRMVLNYFDWRDRRSLANGLVLAVEPFLTPGIGSVYTEADGWTLKTLSGLPGAQYEHTVVITESKPLLVTAV